MLRSHRRHLLCLNVGLVAAFLPLIGQSANASELDYVQTQQVTANIRFDMRPSRQRADVRHVAALGDVIGWQEISDADQVGAILRLPHFKTYWPGGRGSRAHAPNVAANLSPISWRSDIWQLVDRGTRLGTPAVYNVCRDRYISWVVLRNRTTGQTIARWNTHFVPNAWAPYRVSHVAARRAAWHRQAHVTSRVIRELRDQGYPVVGGGDVNRHYSQFLGDLVAYDTDGSRFDYLTHVPDSRMVSESGYRAPLYSDHDAAVVSYWLQNG